MTSYMKPAPSPAQPSIQAGYVGQAGRYSISVQFNPILGAHPALAALSKPFQIMRHSVHACYEFKPPESSFLGRHRRDLPKPLAPSTVRAATKKLVCLSLCDGNDFPATVTSHPRVTQECQRWR